MTLHIFTEFVARYVADQWIVFLLVIVENIFRFAQTKHKCAEFNSIDTNSQDLGNFEIFKQSLPMITLIDNLPDIRHIQPWSLLVQFIHLFNFRELMLTMCGFVIFLHVLFMKLVLVSFGGFHALIDDTKF